MVNKFVPNYCLKHTTRTNSLFKCTCCFRNHKNVLYWYVVVMVSIIRPVGVYQQQAYWAFVITVTVINMQSRLQDGYDLVMFRKISFGFKYVLP